MSKRKRNRFSKYDTFADTREKIQGRLDAPSQYLSVRDRTQHQAALFLADLALGIERRTKALERERYGD